MDIYDTARYTLDVHGTAYTARRTGSVGRAATDDRAISDVARMILE